MHSVRFFELGDVLKDTLLIQSLSDHKQICYKKHNQLQGQLTYSFDDIFIIKADEFW